MKNNKGFSLVELIIVIAIMAILVGVMAPQLIKWIEKSNVSADAQLCDTVRQAITTAMSDPTVLADTAYVAPTGSGSLTSICASAGTTFKSALEETLGCTIGDVDGMIKSNVTSAKASGMTVNIDGSKITVYLTSSDSTGVKAKNGIHMIYAGPECTGLTK